MESDPSLAILWRMFEDAKALTGLPDDPVLEGRSGFLVAFLYDILRLKDPFNTIEHIVEFE